MAYEFQILLSTSIAILTIIILVSNLLKSQVIAYVFQTFVLGFLALSIGIEEIMNGAYSAVEGADFMAIATITIMVKGIVIPLFILRAIKKINPDETPKAFSISISRSIIISSLLIALSYAIVIPVLASEPMIMASVTSVLLPASLAIVLIGLYMAATSKKVYSQLVALLVMENGIYFASISTTFELPALIEATILLDILAAAAILVIILMAIHKHYQDVNVTTLKELRE